MSAPRASGDPDRSDSGPNRSDSGPNRSAGGPDRSAGGPDRSAGGPDRSAGGPDPSGGAPGDLALDLPPGWFATEVDSASGRADAREHLSAVVPDAVRGAASPWIEQLLDAGAQWLFTPPGPRRALGLAVVRSGVGGTATRSRWRRRRALVDEKLILVDDLAVIRAPAVDVVLAICECATTRSAPVHADDEAARSAADELIDAMGVLE